MFVSKPLQTREKGLRSLLAEKGIEAAFSFEGNALKIDDKCVPLFPWRTHFHNRSLQSLIHGEVTHGLSMLRMLYSGTVEDDLNVLLEQELDLAEWLMKSRIVRVYALNAGRVLHVTARLENNVVCALELNANLPAGTRPVFKHELVAETGFVTDRAPDTQVTPQPLYLWSDHESTDFMDVDMKLYGLSEKDATDVRAAFALLSGEEDVEERIREGKRLSTLCEAVWASVRSGMPVNADKEADA